MTLRRLRELAVVVWVALVFAGNVDMGHLSRFAGETGAHSSLGLQCNSEPVVAPNGSSSGGDGGGGGSGIKRCKP